MNIQILANSNIELPSNFSHIPLKYGYAYHAGNLKNITEDTSLKANAFSKLDYLFNYFKPLGDKDKRVAATILEKSAFLDKILPEDFTHSLKIQLNVNSSLNRCFKSIAAPFFSNEDPIMRSVLADQSYIFPGTNQVVIGTKNFDIEPDKMEQGFGLITYLHLKNAPLEDVVTFTLFHEVSHILEQYNTHKFGNIDNPIYPTVSILKLLEEPDKFHEIKNYLKKELPTDQDILADLTTLVSEIYADTGAILLQRNYDIKNNIYTAEKFTTYLNNMIKDREIEHEVLCHLNPTLIMTDHNTSPGLKYLSKQLEFQSETVLSDENMHNIIQKSVTHGIAQTVHNLIEKDSEYSNYFNHLFNLKEQNGNIISPEEQINIKPILSDILNEAPKNKFRP